MINFDENMPAIGVHRAVSFDRYVRWSALSNSQITKLLRSPAHLRASYDELEDDRKVLQIGRSVHTSILEPSTFDDLFTVADQCMALTKKDNARCSNMGIVEHPILGWLCGVHVKGAPAAECTRTVLSPTDYQLCIRMRDAVLADPNANNLLVGDGETELSLVWDDADSGVRCRGRLDRYRSEFAGGAIVDIKKTRDASPRAFARAIYEYGYHRQGAMYLDGARANGLPAKHFVLIAVESAPPFPVVCYRLTDEAISLGRQQLGIAMHRFRECVERDEWPGYTTDIIDVDVPEWASRQVYSELLEVA